MLPQNANSVFEKAVQLILSLLYTSTSIPKQPLSDNPTLVERNQKIRERYGNGEKVSKLAQEFEVSEQRIYQIIHGKRK